MLAHTRWASVGIISEANAHPLNQEELGRVGLRLRHRRAQRRRRQLRRPQGARSRCTSRPRSRPTPRSSPRSCPAASTTAPSRSRRSARRSRRSKARSRSPRRWRRDPGRVLLAQRGSGQALYVGLADDAFVVASEPYGVVEECDRYLRLDGETMLEPGRTRHRRARSSAVDAREHRDRAVVVRRLGVAGDPTPSCKRPRSRHATSTAATLRTTCSRRSTKRPRRSARRCAAGSSSVDGRLDVRLPPETLPAAIVERLRAGTLRRVDRDRAGHRGRSPGKASRTRCARDARRAIAHGRGGRRDRAVGVRARARHVATRSSSRSRSRARRPTPTAPSTSCAHAARR